MKKVIILISYLSVINLNIAQTIENNIPFLKYFDCYTDYHCGAKIECLHTIFEKYDTTKILIKHKLYQKFLLSYSEKATTDYIRIEKNKLYLLGQQDSIEQLLFDKNCKQSFQWKLKTYFSHGKFLSNNIFNIDSINSSLLDTTYFVSCKPILSLSSVAVLNSFVYSAKFGFVSFFLTDELGNNVYCKRVIKK